MSDALNYLYLIYDDMLDLLFNSFYMFTGVSVGWVMVTVIIFAIVIRSIINVPRSMSFSKLQGGNYGKRSN